MYNTYKHSRQSNIGCTERGNEFLSVVWSSFMSVKITKIKIPHRCSLRATVSSVDSERALYVYAQLSRR